MSASPACHRCGAETTESTTRGLCPKCLLWEGLAEAVEPGAVARGRRTEDGDRKSEDRDQRAEIAVQASPATGRPAPFTHFGDYELGQEIGRGGMGVVYKARQKSLDRVVALKMLLFGPQASPGFVKRFRAEAVAAASLQHPNIVAIHEVGVHEGQQFFAMDYVAGPSLAEVVRHQPLPGPRAAGYLKSIAEAIHYAHERGILHRDLKPSNVLIDGQDQPRVTDFGLARRLQDSQPSALNPQLTFTGQVIGSPSYIPPEQALGKRGKVSRRSDVYALGATLYHLLTGRPPFQGETLTETLEQVLNTEPLPPHLLKPGIPPDLETICLKCLEKEAARRYPTAQDLAAELGRFLEDKPIQARPVSTAGRAWKWCRRRPALAAMGAGLALTIVLGLAGVLWEWRQAGQSAQAELRQRQRAEASAYAADMHLAQLAVAGNDRSAALRLLDRYRGKSGPDLRGWEWRYLWQFCQEDELASLHRYTNGIRAIAVSPDRKRMAVASSGEVALWNLAQRQQVAGFRTGIAQILALSLADELLAITTVDAAGQPWIELRELNAGKVIERLRQETEPGSLALSPAGSLLAASDKGGSIRVVDWKSGQILTNLSLPPTRNEGAPIVTFSPDGSRLAIAEGWSGHARLLDVQKKILLDLPTPSGATVTALAFGPAGDLLAGGHHFYANSNHTISLWDARSGKLRAQLANPAENVSALFFTSDGRQLLAANSDGSLRTWSMVDHTALRCLVGPRASPGAVALLPDDRTLVVAGSQSLRLWDLAAGSPTSTHTNLLTGFSYEGLRDLQPRDFDAETLHPIAARRLAFAFSPDSSAFITTDPTGSLALWNTWPVQLQEELTALGSNHWGVALSPDGRWLAAGHAPPGRLTIWDWPARRAVTNLDVAFDFFGTLRFSRSGRFLVSWVFDNQARISTRLWRVGDWAEVPLSRRQLPGAWSVDLSSDDRLLAASYDDAVKLFRFPSGAQAGAVAHPGRIYALFSRDDHVLIAAAWNDCVKLWDVATQRWLADLEGRFDGLWAVALSPDGRRLATGGNGPTESVKLWDLAAHRELLSLSADGLFFLHVAFSPDGNTLAATAMSGATHLWHAPSWEEIEAAESRHKAQ